VVGGFGAVALYISLFLKEDREGKIQDRVDALWVAVDDRQKLTGSRAAAIFNKVATVVSDAFDRFFGPKSVSIQVIGVSSSLAFAALFLLGGLILGVLLHMLKALPAHPTNLPANIDASLSIVTTFCLIVGSVLVVVSTLPSVWPCRFTRTLSLLPAVFFVWAIVNLMRHHTVTVLQSAVLLALIFSTFSDITFLAIVRASIRWISKELRPFTICIVISCQIALTILIIWLPEKIGIGLLVNHKWPIFATFLYNTAIFNVFTAIAAGAFTVTLVLFLLQRALWPIIDSLVYPFARYKIVRNHRAMATLGVSCLVFAFPSIRFFFAGFLSWLIMVLYTEHHRPADRK